jgi:CelD/BcsL family acetyltransferase involved in cellulose biosynthesis
VSAAVQALSMPLNFQIGARTLFAIPRRLVRVPLSLDEALHEQLPVLPPLPADAHGYAVTSLPTDREAAIAQAAGGMIVFVRQRYTRYYAELSGGHDAYLARLSSNTRQGLRRKAKKLAGASGGTIDVQRFRTVEELREFHRLARDISARTYQERLLGSGLPDTPEFMRDMAALADGDSVRAWLLRIGGVPAAYLYCPVRDDTVIYAHVGHDPAYHELSPGAVLQGEAMRDLFAEGRFARFDFTEGEGQHKRAMATGGMECVDVLLLRRSIFNHAVMAALATFDAAVALAKAVVGKAGLERIVRRVRRG